MAGYDYGNARLRAMRSRLLSVKELEGFAEAGSLRGLITGLARTAYREPIESALAHRSGMDSIREALSSDLIQGLGMIRRFYMEEAGSQVDLIMLRYDVQNLKAVLRGVAKNLPVPDILLALIPVGTIGYGALSELAHAPDPRAAIDSLASMGFRLAQPLLELRSELPSADLSRIELSLDQWFFREARKFLEDTRQQKSTLSVAIDLDADLTNILTIIRFAHAPHERKLLHTWLGSDDLEKALVLPGQIPSATLILAGSQDSLASAVGLLVHTLYGPALQAGLETFNRSGRLSDLEKQLRHYHLVRMAQLIAKDPLGIGVVFGYIALKVNEINNLRWIAQGINLGLDPKAIQAELEILS